MNKIRVLLVDDQSIITKGLKMILDMEDDIRVTGTASNGQEAVSFCRWQCPDVILMDIKMPVMDGVEASGIIKNEYPNVKIIVLTTFNDKEFIFDAIKRGASGYMLKESSPEEIISAVRTVNMGGSIMEPGVAAKVIEEFTRMADEKRETKGDECVSLLSERETEIARLVGMGKNNKEIAKELFISEGTVRNHITSILEKLNLRDRTQLAIFAIRNNMV